jgi:NADPH-dependent 2,4-dienoyl-CoA reductase/sulfur reductase-like enzyme
LHLPTELDRVVGAVEERGRAWGTGSGGAVPAECVGMDIGVAPNGDFLEGSGIETDRGVLVDEYLRTSAPNVYAAGDCTQFRREGIGHREIDQLWYTARAEGRAAARIISGGDEPYRSGVFFNSAKFYNVEYQVYGDVKPELAEDEETLCWRHPEKNRLIRINYTEKDHRIVGFNLLGVRCRHAVCGRWIREGRTLEYVLPRLAEANFDPEFADRHEEALIDLYNERYPDTARAHSRPAAAGWFDRSFSS